MSQKRLGNILSRYVRCNVFVVGDLILDVFIWGSVRRISPEAPVPIVEINRESEVLGGAANVAHNLRVLGSKVSLGGLLGKDQEAKSLLNQMSSLGIQSQAVLQESNKYTTKKTRVIANQQQIVRIDREDKARVSKIFEKKLMEHLNKQSKNLGAILIEDYGKGVVSQSLVHRIVDFAKKHNILVAVDPQMGRFIDYRGVDIATPNFQEACYYSDLENQSVEGVEKVGKILLDRWDCTMLLITLGEKGMCLFERGKKLYRISTVAKEVFDVSGAGDTVIATFILSLLAGASSKEAAILANMAAGIVVGKLGTASVRLDEMKKELGYGK